jgi:hypothetical protein
MIPLFRSLLSATGGSFTNGPDLIATGRHGRGHPPDRRTVSTILEPLNGSFYTTGSLVLKPRRTAVTKKAPGSAGKSAAETTNTSEFFS